MSDEGSGKLRPSSLTHWQRVWERADPGKVSWFQARPDTSLALIEAAGVGTDAGIVDVGGGASTLVDHLLEAGFRDVTVLDITATALGHSRARLGEPDRSVRWIEADILRLEPARTWDLWHDRAVFHFLTDPADRAAYRTVLAQSIGHDGQAIIAVFGPEGPTRCSGLDTCRYSPTALQKELGENLEIAQSRLQIHTTPGGAEQQFLYALIRSVA